MTQRGNNHFQVTSQPYRVEHDNMCKKNKIKKETNNMVHCEFCLDGVNMSL